MSAVDRDYSSAEAERHGLSATKLKKVGLLVAASLVASATMAAAALLMWIVTHPRLAGF